jgi:hypothetical protein
LQGKFLFLLKLILKAMKYVIFELKEFKYNSYDDRAFCLERLWLVNVKNEFDTKQEAVEALEKYKSGFKLVHQYTILEIY